MAKKGKNPWEKVHGYSKHMFKRGLVHVPAYQRFKNEPDPKSVSIWHNPVTAIAQRIVRPEFSMEGLYDFLGLGVGFTGSAALPSFIPVVKGWNKGWIKPLLTLGSGIVLASITKMVLPRKVSVAKSVLNGSLVMVFAQVLASMLNLAKPAAGSFGSNLATTLNPTALSGSNAVRAQIEESVLKELNKGKVGQPAAESSYKRIGQPRAELSYSTIGNFMDTSL